MSTALILVDIQNDFLPGGPLAVPNGNDVIKVANQLIARFELIIATKDWHPDDHLSFASQHPGKQPGEEITLASHPQILWPDHCVQGTSGAEFASDLQLPSDAHVFCKGMNRAIDSYSGFFDNGHRTNTGLAQFLTDQGVNSVVIAGLATDYCVKFTALDAWELGFQTRLVIDGCRGVELNPGDVETSIESMRQAGIDVTDSQGLTMAT